MQNGTALNSVLFITKKYFTPRFCSELNKTNIVLIIVTYHQNTSILPKDDKKWPEINPPLLAEQSGTSTAFLTSGLKERST